MAKVYTNNQLLLKECISQEFKETGLFSDESSYFEYFACSQVLKNYDLSDDELSDGILGGGNDGGCDGIYLFLNNYLVTPDQIPTLSAPKGSTLNLVIVQAKNTTGFGEDAIMKWKTVTENLMNMSCDVSSFAGRYNDDVLDHFTMFRDSITRLIRSQIKIKIDFYYVTLATEKHINVNRQADELCEKIHSMYPTAAVAMIDLLCSTGIRVGELVKLNRLDIDFENRECIVFGKGNKQRKVYFDARTKIHLQKYINSRTDDNEALFVSLLKPFTRLQISGVEIRLRKIGKDLNFNKVHPHKFRRTLATITFLLPAIKMDLLTWTR